MYKNGQKVKKKNIAASTELNVSVRISFRLNQVKAGRKGTLHVLICEELSLVIIHP